MTLGLSPANPNDYRFFAFAGTQVANTPQTSTGSQSTDLPQGPDPSQLLYISLCFGFSLAVNAWVFYRISGGLFNPAVSRHRTKKIIRY
jgi:aquaporin rerated protein, other eukaryote